MINYTKLGLEKQRGDVLRLRKACLDAARKEAPKRTGNLRLNGIYSRATKYGFDIVWDKSLVYYLEIVDKGQGRVKKNKSGSINKKSQSRIEKNKGFVQRGINAVMCVVGEYENGNKDKVYQLAKKTSSTKLTPYIFKKDFDLKAKENKNIKRLYDKVVSCVKYTATHDDTIDKIKDETTYFAKVKYNKNDFSRQVEVVSEEDNLSVFQEVLGGS